MCADSAQNVCWQCTENQLYYAGYWLMYNNHNVFFSVKYKNIYGNIYIVIYL